MSENIEYLEDGWVLWSSGRGGTTEGLMVYAQLFAEKEGDRGEIVQLAISGRNLAGTDPATDVTADRLRSVPVARIETLANTSPEFRPHVNGTPQNTMGQAFDAFRQESNRYILAKARRKHRKPLTRPDGSNPDAFYKQVAEAYRDVVRNDRKVAVALAKEADVPVGTVHRWILEARRRGFLPSARQGRAG
jgi:hypothetical protein